MHTDRQAVDVSVLMCLLREREGSIQSGDDGNPCHRSIPIGPHGLDPSSTFFLCSQRTAQNANTMLTLSVSHFAIDMRVMHVLSSIDGD